MDIKQSAANYISLIKPDWDDILFVSIGIICYGVYQIHVPAAFIVGGVLGYCTAAAKLLLEYRRANGNARAAGRTMHGTQPTDGE